MKKFLAKKRRNRFISSIGKKLLKLHKGYENLNYNCFENGEYFILKTISDHLPIETIFDVGANKGKWSTMATDIFTKASCYAFEILPDTYKHLTEEAKRSSRITHYNVGLSDENETIKVYHSPDRSGTSTCVENFSENFHGFQPKISTAEVITGDHFCSQQDISCIDLLKIDVEGYDPRVLKGFKNLLKNEKIKIIQFEYGYVNISVNFLLKDFYAYLGSFNMKIGKIYPDYVDFKDYKLQDENFYGPNYLAVHSSLEPLIAVLKK